MPAADKYAGMNKKMRQRMKIYERMNKGKAPKAIGKRMTMIQPEKEWGKEGAKLISMRCLETKEGYKLFSLEEGSTYKAH